MNTALRRRPRTDLRKKPRRQFQYRAQILLGEEGPLQPCAIADISDTGARLVMDQAAELPQRFILVLTALGNAQRICRLIWQDGPAAGVAFSRREP